MNKETFEKANELNEELSDTERSLSMLKHCENCKSWGLEIKLQDNSCAPHYSFKLPKEATDLILEMSKSILENKLNRLKEEFETL